MSAPVRLGVCAALGVSLSAQIPADLVDRHRAAFHTQATDADMKREGGTQPRDWNYDLPDGITTRQVTFYVDGGTPLYGKMFLPRGFNARGAWPAVVVGHGINALSIGIEKYGARFADRGLVAMAIDYQSYGFSGSGADDLRLLEADTGTDAHVILEKRARVLVKRTNLNNAHEVDDYRAALSFLQGEPGVDAGRIGIWGSSNAGSVVIAVAAADARVKAVVSQVAGTPPSPRGPAPIAAAMLDDGVRRARTGQGAEVDGGFSFKSKVDMWSTQRNRDVRPGSTLDQILPSTKILFLPAENDELSGRGGAGAIAATKFLAEHGVTAQTIVYPEISHFQAYSYTGFDVGSTLAADWFLKYLGRSEPAKASIAGLKPRATEIPGARPAARAMTPVAQALRPAIPEVRPEGVIARDVTFVSEGVQCYGRIYLPKGFTPESKAAAIVLAPGWGETAASIDTYAARFAGRGMVAMAIDYRGWGRSGGFVYLAEPVRWDDRLRFSQHTAKVRLRRKRLIPEAQVLDIRNAISFIQGEPGVDRARIGVWGTDTAGGHALVVAATDARVKAAVGQVPLIEGRELPRKAFAPPPEVQAELVRLARSGEAPGSSVPAAAMNAAETKLALAEYHPFWYADAVPPTAAVLFVTAEKDLKVNNAAHAVAAAKLLKGPNGVTEIPGAGHTLAAPAAFEAAVEAAAAWFLKYL